MTNHPNLNWQELNATSLEKRISNPEVLARWKDIVPETKIAGTKKTIYFMRDDGAIFVQPKDGSAPYCKNCEDDIGYSSRVFFDETDSGLVPNCVNCKKGDILRYYRY